jgi:hypothetical protein
VNVISPIQYLVRKRMNMNLSAMVRQRVIVNSPTEYIVKRRVSVVSLLSTYGRQ